MKTKINRRAFLYAAGTAGVALPFLEGLPERSAFAQTDDPRFALFIVTANGVVQQYGSEPERFWPLSAPGPLTTANMTAMASERCTGLLADYADKLLFVKGLRYPMNITGCGHAQGLVQCLTARTVSGTNNTATSTGPSVDTVISNALNPQGVGPLALYAGKKGGFINEKISFSAAGQVRSAEGNPLNVYNRLAGLGVFDTATGQPNDAPTLLAERRKSVNDLVRDQINALKGNPRLSQADRDRLDLHFTSIRDLENTMVEMGASCSEELVDMTQLQAMSSGEAFKAENNNIETVGKLHIELAALTFACNQNRVATIQIGDGTDNTRYTIPGVNNGNTLERFHWVSHRIQSDGSEGAAIPQAVEWHTAIDRFRMGTFKHLLDKWSQYNVAKGPLLDNAFAMWTSHVAQGPSHGFGNLPVIIAGNAGGYLKTGNYVDAGNVSNARLFNTLLTAVGIPTDNFGEGGTGTLPMMIA